MFESISASLSRCFFKPKAKPTKEEWIYPISNIQLNGETLTLTLNPNRPSACQDVTGQFRMHQGIRHRKCCEELAKLQLVKMGELEDDFQYTVDETRSTITMTNNLQDAMICLYWSGVSDMATGKYRKLFNWSTASWSEKIKPLIEIAKKREEIYPISNMQLKDDTLTITLNKEKHNACEIVIFQLRYRSSRNDYQFAEDNTKSTISVTGNLLEAIYGLYSCGIAFDRAKEKWPDNINQLITAAIEANAPPPSPEPNGQVRHAMV